MKINKFKELVSIAERGVELPECVLIEDMSVDKYIYLQDDTLNPVILIFANFISSKMFDKKLFNIKVYKTEESLCFGKILEDGEDDSDDIESDTIRLLVLMEALDAIFYLKQNNTLDLTPLVTNWRQAVGILDDNEEIEPENHIEKLILENIQKLNLKNDNRISNERF